MSACQFHARYRVSDATCDEPATLSARDIGIPPLLVCRHHAEQIARSHPMLGGVEDRFFIWSAR